jgi:hypothetical protein
MHMKNLKKNTFFDDVSSILILLGLRNDIFFEEKESTHLNLIIVATKNIFGQKNEVWVLAGRLQTIFYRYDPDTSGKEAFWNFESLTTFALLIAIYLP